jgi:hypothetical protein
VKKSRFSAEQIVAVHGTSGNKAWIGNPQQESNSERRPSRRRSLICTVLAFAAFIGCPGRLIGQIEDADHVAVFEIGGAADWRLTGGPAGFGGTLAVEVTPIERWLELEAGITGLAANGRREMSTDLVFKKPFQLSPTVEFMTGIGPEVSWDLAKPQRPRSLAAEFVLDFMFWPTRNVGWYAEPSYSFTGLHATSDRSLGLTAGLIIGLPSPQHER